MGPLFSNKVKMLADRLAIEKYPYTYEADGNIISLPHAEANIPDMPNHKFYVTSISNKKDAWGIIFIMAMRSISDTDPAFSENNTKLLLEETARIYRKRYPTLHQGDGAPLIEWSVDLSYVEEADFRYGTVEGICRFRGTVQDAYTALTLIADIPTMAIAEEVKDDSSDTQDAVRESTP